MWDTNGRKIKHFLKALNLHRKKTGLKNEKAVDSYINVLKKEEKEGLTAWVKNAKMKAEVLERRGLSHLSSKIS